MERISLIKNDEIVKAFGNVAKTFVTFFSNLILMLLQKMSQTLP